MRRASGRFAAAGHGFRAWESNARNPGPPARRSALGNPRSFRRDFPLRPRVPPSRTGPRLAARVGQWPTARAHCGIGRGVGDAWTGACWLCNV